MPYYLGNSAGAKSDTNTRWEYDKSVSHEDPQYHYSREQGGGVDWPRLTYAKLSRSRLILKTGRKTLGNFVDSSRSDGYLFSERVRLQLEALDPGLHRYCEVPIFTADRAPWHEKYWFYNYLLIPRIDAVDLERSAKWVRWREFPSAHGAPKRELSGVIASGYDTPEVFLQSDTVIGPNLFREARTSLNWFFLSDRLVAALKAAKALAGIEHRYVGI